MSAPPAQRRPRGPRASDGGAGVQDEQTLDEQSLQAQVIVVGAGPGGAATAITLARRGVDVLLLDKAAFPREKICGDGLTPRAVRMLIRLGVDVSVEAGWARNRGLRIHGGGGQPFELAWPQLAQYPDFGLVCRRSVFDDLMAGHAVAAGARLITGAQVTEPLRDERSGRITGVRTASGRRYSAPIVVAADGNPSRLGRAMGLARNPRRPLGVAVRSYFARDRSDDDHIESWLELWDGEPGKSNLLPGYGWVFPAGDGTVNVGLGTLNSSKRFEHIDHRDLLRRWVSAAAPELGLHADQMLEPIRGAALPMAFSSQPAYRDGLLLVGDAGGMVSPFNGEGISYAMEAGELAADAIGEALGRGVSTAAAEKALQGYPVALASKFGGYYRLGTIFVKLIGNPAIMHACTTYGLPRKRLMQLVHKLLGNLTDSSGGDVDDHIINALSSVSPRL